MILAGFGQVWKFVTGAMAGWWLDGGWGDCGMWRCLGKGVASARDATRVRM